MPYCNHYTYLINISGYDKFIALSLSSTVQLYSALLSEAHRLPACALLNKWQFFVLEAYAHAQYSSTTPGSTHTHTHTVHRNSFTIADDADLLFVACCMCMLHPEHYYFYGSVYAVTRHAVKSHQQN